MNCENCKYINMTIDESKELFLKENINKSIRCQYYKQKGLLKGFEPFLNTIEGMIKAQNQIHCKGKYFISK